jgi:acetyl-CoA C-acetyltransferase
MIYENYLQLLGRAGPRQVREPPTLALSHNLGGMPNQNVSAIAIVGMLGA